MKRLFKFIIRNEKFMSINIITPCYDEDEKIIFKNINSVKNQVRKNYINHICIFDGIDRISEIKNKIVNYNNLHFYKTKFNHADYGDYVRRLGTKISLKNKIKSVGYLDADNTFEKNHISTVLKVHTETRKNIIISNRNFITNDIENFEESTDFFDTNQITFFGEKIKIGLLWGKYPRQLSLIGDRIISNYIKNHHVNDIAFTNKNTVNYSFSKIPRKKVNDFKTWYERDYYKYKPKFKKVFGFDLQL